MTVVSAPAASANYLRCGPRGVSLSPILPTLRKDPLLRVVLATRFFGRVPRPPRPLEGSIGGSRARAAPECLGVKLTQGRRP